jgi:hypothetical protein
VTETFPFDEHDSLGGSIPDAVVQAIEKAEFPLKFIAALEPFAEHLSFGEVHFGRITYE